MFYKIVENGYITMIGKSQRVPSNSVEITEEKHTELTNTIKARPDDTLDFVYRLYNETETFVPCERTHEETVDWYVEKVSGGEMTIEEVPEEYRAEVEASLPKPTEPTYTLDEAAAIIAEEAASYE